MTTSFYNGINGMTTQQTGIDVLSDNIANVDTVGFKKNDTDFSTLFSAGLTTTLNSPATSDIGLSATVATTTMDLSQGSFQPTDNVFDLALDGKGWMAVTGMDGQTYYTRTGSFVKDADGTLVSANGNKLNVINPHNLTQTDATSQSWNFDPSIPTDNLVSSTAITEPVQLPNDITFPAQATQNITIGGNLPNEIKAPDPKPATPDSDFGVLYDSGDFDMGIKNGDDLGFSFGADVSYSSGLAKYNMCIANDVEDGNPVNVDFDVNGENIKLTLPDGSSSADIIDAITKELDNKEIPYSKTNSAIQLKDENKLFVKSNGGDIVTKSEAVQKLSYNNSDNTDGNFTTIQDFMDKLQNMSDFSYGAGAATVSLDSKGRIQIANNSATAEVVASSYPTDKTNDAFMTNLDTLGNTIHPNTHTSTKAFERNYQGFTGDIINSQGTKNDLKFDFYKTKIEDDNTTTWHLDLTETDPDGNVISTTQKDLKFNAIGKLIDQSPITIDNGGTTTNVHLINDFTGITSIDKDNTGFNYIQDGFTDGHLVGYDVNDSGEIIANFSNDKTGVIAQIPIYHFQNEQGLDNIGGDKYTVTNNSGAAFTYTNEDGSYLTGVHVKNYSLENSNVNMGEAMTQLIIVQKAFDANSKSITTSDQMIKKAIDMKR